MVRYRSERAGLETVRRRQADTEKRIGMAGWACGFDIVMLGWAERRTYFGGMGVYIRITHETQRYSSGRGEPPPGPQRAIFGGWQSGRVPLSAPPPPSCRTCVSHQGPTVDSQEKFSTAKAGRFWQLAGQQGSVASGQWPVGRGRQGGGAKVWRIF